jgi:YHS domain-containing protein
MVARLLLFIVLGIFVARAFWRFVDGIAAGVRGGPPRGDGELPTHGVAMVRDPVCGTFVAPDPARMITDGRTRVFFCSDACRDRYRARA